EIRAGWIARVVEHGHGRDRRPRACAAHEAEEPVTPTGEAEAGERDERPHEIELLFDREGPHVPQWRHFREQVEVRLTRRDEAPVRAVEERGQSVAAQAVELVGRRFKDRERAEAIKSGLIGEPLVFAHIPPRWAKPPPRRPHGRGSERGYQVSRFERPRKGETACVAGREGPGPRPAATPDLAGMQSAG